MTLEVEQVGSSEGVASALDIGQVSLPIRKKIDIPYLSDQRIFLAPGTGLFVASYFDWSATGSSSLSPTRAEYRPMTDGKRRPIRERICLAVSPHLGEVLPNIPNPPSPERAALAKRVVADVWGSSFAENQKRVELLRSYGVKDLAIIYHVWQH